MTLPLIYMFSAYTILAGLMLVINPQSYEDIIGGLRDSRALSFLTGVFLFFLGATLLALHHATATALEIFVTTVVAIMALKGALLMVLPASLIGFAGSIGLPRLAPVWGTISLAMGAGLAWLAASA